MRAGVDAETGMLLTGWDHCLQSLRKCIRTRFRSRIMHRHIGSRQPEMQDQNAHPDTIFEVYRTVADAINDPDEGEPGYNLQAIELLRGGRDGRFVFLLDGEYFPRGHLRDYSVREQRSAQVGVELIV